MNLLHRTSSEWGLRKAQCGQGAFSRARQQCGNSGPESHRVPQQSMPQVSGVSGVSGGLLLTFSPLSKVPFSLRVD